MHFTTTGLSAVLLAAVAVEARNVRYPVPMGRRGVHYPRAIGTGYANPTGGFATGTAGPTAGPTAVPVPSPSPLKPSDKPTDAGNAAKPTVTVVPVDPKDPVLPPDYTTPGSGSGNSPVGGNEEQEAEEEEEQTTSSSTITVSHVVTLTAKPTDNAAAPTNGATGPIVGQGEQPVGGEQCGYVTVTVTDRETIYVTAPAVTATISPEQTEPGTGAGDEEDLEFCDAEDEEECDEEDVEEQDEQCEDGDDECDDYSDAEEEECAHGEESDDEEEVATNVPHRPSQTKTDPWVTTTTPAAGTGTGTAGPTAVPMPTAGDQIITSAIFPTGTAPAARRTATVVPVPAY